MSRHWSGLQQGRSGTDAGCQPTVLLDPMKLHLPACGHRCCCLALCTCQGALCQRRDVAAQFLHAHDACDLANAVAVHHIGKLKLLAAATPLLPAAVAALQGRTSSTVCALLLLLLLVTCMGVCWLAARRTNSSSCCTRTCITSSSSSTGSAAVVRRWPAAGHEAPRWPVTPQQHQLGLKLPVGVGRGGGSSEQHTALVAPAGRRAA